METPPSSPPREARPSPGRLANIQTNVRNLLRASSVYPETVVAPSVQNTPKLPRAPFLRRVSARISTDRPSVPHPDFPSGFSFGFEGERPREQHHERQQSRHEEQMQERTPAVQYPATTYSPASLPSRWSERYEATPPVPQSSWSEQESTDRGLDGDLEAQQPRRKRRRRKNNAWVKRKHRHSVHPRHMPNAKQSERRKRFAWCVGSGAFLAAMLTIYLSLALTITGLNQTVHVMFILIILGSTVVFCHSLIRLCMFALRPHRHHRSPIIPELSGPEGFKPDTPIRVHLARDEEIAVGDNEQMREVAKETLQQPPPAYGLWRCSVRVDPNLLHWQRAPTAPNTNPPSPAIIPPITPITPISQYPIAQSAAAGEATQQLHRPPSYASDDGVAYAVEVQPRSTQIFQQPFPFAARPPSGMHPAYRGP